MSKFHALSGLLALLIAGAAQAGVAVSPILLNLDARHAAVSVTVTNDTDQEKTFQSEPVIWRQHDGVDDYQPTGDIIASPPLFRLAPGASQIVRVGPTVPRNGTVEGTYRLFLQELPPKLENADGGPQLRMLLRLGLPVFLRPATPRTLPLQWQAKRRADGSVELSAHNPGNVHARLSDLNVSADGASAPRVLGTLTYLFGSASRNWTFKPDAGWHGPLKITVQTEQGVQSAAVPLEGG